MERVQELIDKLRKQHQQHEGAERLLATVQNLQEVLLAIVRSEEAKSGGKVAVVLPPRRRTTTVEVAAPKAAPVHNVVPPPNVVESPVPAATNALPDKKIAAAPAESAANKTEAPAAPAPLAAPTAAPEPLTAAVPEPRPAELQQPKEPYALQKPAVAAWAPPVTPTPPKTAEPENREVFHLHFDTTDEAPTLLQQYAQSPKELHEVISSESKESLNDRLKQDRPELAHKLKETPIKDLRKAIGVNDKYLFLKELFRGDEAMYERSIKTINNFHILPEAEYWISRELKVKLGWDDSSEIVQTFYQLVKRRFS